MKIILARFLKSKRGCRPRNLGTALIKELSPSYKLRNKIFLVYALVISISLGLLSFIIYNDSLKNSKEQLRDGVSNYMTNAASLIEEIMNGVEQQCIGFISSFAFTDAITQMDEKPILTAYEHYLALERLIATYESLYNNYRIQIYFVKKHVLFNNLYHYFYMSDSIADRTLAFRTDKSRGWFINPQDTGTLCYFIRTNEPLSQPSPVYVVFSIPVSTIYSAMENIGGPGGETVIAAHNGQIIAAINPNMQPEIIVEKASLEKDVSGSLNIRLDKDYFAIFQRIESKDLLLVSVSCSEDLEQRAKNGVIKLLYTMIFLLLASFVLSFLIASRITKRLHSLALAMSNIEKNGFEFSFQNRGKDEIGQLINSFAMMNESAKKLMDDIKDTELKRRKAELDLLQSQINPHFLYNTLDSVNWLAITINAPQISYIIRNLSQFLRLGLNNGKQITNVGEEIRHTQAYFNIQKYRFDGRIELEIDIPPELVDLKINTLTIQPLVENAIIHGILSQDDLIGKIVITGKIEDVNAFIEVNDNGCGIPRERLKKIKASLMEKPCLSNEGYGLYNVHKRLKYTFGNDYGLNIISEYEKGTSCIIVIPARDK